MVSPFTELGCRISWKRGFCIWLLILLPRRTRMLLPDQKVQLKINLINYKTSRYPVLWNGFSQWGRINQLWHGFPNYLRSEMIAEKEDKNSNHYITWSNELCTSRAYKLKVESTHFIKKSKVCYPTCKIICVKLQKMSDLNCLSIS